jgi:hypothetical protein
MHRLTAASWIDWIRNIRNGQSRFMEHATRRGRPMKSSRGWKRPFDEPIPLPGGHPLVTLEDAGNYITKLPNAVHEAAECQAAMEAMILVVTLGGPTMFARHRRHEGIEPKR